jgi:hypothetical protein
LWRRDKPDDPRSSFDTAEPRLAPVRKHERSFPMITDQLVFEARMRAFDAVDLKVASLPRPRAWSDEGDILEDANRLLGNLFSQDVETTTCSPVIPTRELTRIRNNVVNQYGVLRNAYSNVGGSLVATGLVNQYRAVFSAMEGGSYCYYTSDEQLVRDIQTCAAGANQILSNAFNQYANTFAAKLSPIRGASGALQAAASSATTSVEPVINAYKTLWGYNFDFELFTGVNATLDNLLAEYDRLMNGSNVLLQQGVARVQNLFEAEVRQSNVVFAGFGEARTFWDTKDGATGYGMYVDNMRMYQECLDKLNRFIVLDTQLNRQIFGEISQHVADVKRQFATFPNFVRAMPTTGFNLDPGTSALKFYARQLLLNLAAAAGAHFTTVIAPGQSLIGTGFSYQHGGKMPPHQEHKDGKDCDIFSVYFRVGGAGYDEARAIQMATFLLSNGVSRLIYTNAAVVAAANAACPTNAVAVVGSGHETHMHFDLDQAA